MIYYYMIRFDMVYVYLFSEALIQLQIHFNSCLMFFFFFLRMVLAIEEDNSNNNIEVENNLESDLEED